jgi:hypothetical protein
MKRNIIAKSIFGLMAGFSFNVAVVRSANAQLILNLTSDEFDTTGVNQVTQTFSGTLINDYNQSLYLNGDFATVDAPLAIDDTPFINYFVLPTDASGNLLDQPTLAANGGSVTVDLFTVTVPQNTPPGLYNGVFAVEYGFNPGDLTNTTAANFQVNVSGPFSTPEPGNVAMLVGMSLSGVGFLVRRRK